GTGRGKDHYGEREAAHPAEDHQRGVAAVDRQPEGAADRYEPDLYRALAEHVQQRDQRDVRPDEHDDADGDAEQARDDEPAALAVRARRERVEEADDAGRKRVGAEQDREGLEADAGPEKDHDAEGDREQAVQAERPPHLRQLRVRHLVDPVECGFHRVTSLGELDAPTIARRAPDGIGEGADRCANSAALQPCRKPSENSLMRRSAPAEKDGCMAVHAKTERRRVEPAPATAPGRDVPRPAVKATAAAVAVVAIAFGLWKVRSIIILLLLALTFAAAIRPGVEWLT